MVTTERTLPKTAERYVSLRAEGVEIDNENRTISLSFSSNAPVEMRGWDGSYSEVLEHGEGNVRLDRLNARAPLLFNHDRDNLIGVIETATTDGSTGRATVRFSKSDEGQKRFNEVTDGILSNVSVGYVRHRVVSEGERDGVETVRVTDWEPLEISLVTVPADTSVGVGRNHDKNGETVRVESQTPPKQEDRKMAEEATKIPAVDVTAEREKAVKDERKRLSEIDSAAKLFIDRGAEVRDLASQAKNEGWSADKFRAEALPKLPNVREAKPVELPKKEMRKYSLARAISCARSGKFDGIEGEVHDALLKNRGQTPDNMGILIPSEVFGIRTLTAGTSGAAAELVTEETMGLIEKLDNKPTVELAGAARLNGLSGDVVLPKQTGGATAYWLSETEATTASDIATGLVRMTPKRLAVLTKFSNQLSTQSAVAVEGLLRMDISKRIAIALDLAAFQGTGADGEPKGLFNYDTTNSGINTNTYGAAATLALVNTAIKELLDDNVDVSSLAGIISPTAWAKWAAKATDSGSGKFLWEGSLTEGVVGPGVRGYVSNHLPSNKSVFGNFSDMLIGMWESVNLIVDPYTSKASGITELYAEILTDLAVRHPESFVISTDSAAQ